MKKINLIGQRFSNLVVIAEAFSRRHPYGTKACWLCRCDCGAEIEIETRRLRNYNVQSCGCSRYPRKEKSPSWKGGRRILKSGYVTLRRPEFPGKENYGPEVFEHVVIMSRYLNQVLRKGETVHHKNGIRDDNRIENLELWAKNHGAGQRVEDLVTWAKEILQRYDRPAVSPCCV